MTRSAPTTRLCPVLEHGDVVCARSTLSPRRVSIRPCRSDERDLAAAIHRASATFAYVGIFPLEDPFPWEQTLARWRTFVGNILMAESDSTLEVVGFVAFDDTELHALYVLSEHWGRGIGEQLLQAAGAVSELWVLEANQRARSFYERRGWRADGTAREQHGVLELRYRRSA